MSYIGELSIRQAQQDGDNVIVTFKKEHPEITIDEKLYNEIKSESKGRGNVTDVVSHLLATKLLMQLAEYNLEYYMIDTVGTKAKVLAHNLREDIFSKAFNCQGTDEIKIKQLIDNFEDDEKETK
jgi:hypothetical protein